MTDMTGYQTIHTGSVVEWPNRRFMAFSLAVFASLAIHGAALLMVPGTNEQGIANFGQGGISVSLGPAGRDAGGEAVPEPARSEVAEETNAAEPEVVEASEVLDTVSTETVSLLPEPDVLTVAEVPDAREVEAAETEVMEVEIVEAEVAEIAVLEVPTAKSAEVVFAAKVVQPPLPRRRPHRITKPSAQEPPKVEIAAKPRKVVHRETTKSEAAVALEQVKQARPETADGEPTTLATKQIAGQGGLSGQAGLSEVGQGDNTAGGGAPGVGSDYYREVSAWLEKHKRYPRRSKLRHEQGIVLLRFVVNRDGMVTVSAIKKSSGHKRLDKEAMGMIERAQPLPAMPDDMRQANLDLVVPVKFHLQ